MLYFCLFNSYSSPYEDKWLNNFYLPQATLSLNGGADFCNQSSLISLTILTLALTGSSLRLGILHNNEAYDLLCGDKDGPKLM